MNFLKTIKSFFCLKRHFSPNPRMEEFVLRIDKLITLFIVIQHSEWNFAAYSEESKQKMKGILLQIEGVLQEGGEELREYLLPWKGVKKYSHEDSKRVRVANQLQ